MKKINYSIFSNPSYPKVKFGIKKVWGYSERFDTNGVCVFFLKKAFIISILIRKTKIQHDPFMFNTRIRFSVKKNEEN